MNLEMMESLQEKKLLRSNAHGRTSAILRSAKCELEIASKRACLRPQSQSDVLKIAKDGIFKTW